MYSVNSRGYDITCESTQEVLALVGAAEIPAPKQTRPTTTRAAKGQRRTTPTAAEKRKRNAKARASYRAKHPPKAAAALAEEAIKKQDEEREEVAAATPTTAETHHGEKQTRADTSGEVIAVLRRSGLPLTIPEIRDDLQKAGWKYKGPDPKGTIRGTLTRLVTKGTVAKGSANGALTYRIARVEHDDPLPHQQRESDV